MDTPGYLEEALFVVTVPDVDDTVSAPRAKRSIHSVVGDAVYWVHHFSLALLDAPVALGTESTTRRWSASMR